MRRLDKHCEILDPEASKRFVASSNWNSGGKQHICEVLDRFYRCLGIKWTRPRYQQVESLPWIPHTDEVDALINGLGNPTIGTFVHAVKDSGVFCCAPVSKHIPSGVSCIVVDVECMRLR